jgi:hypothetical protein
MLSSSSLWRLVDSAGLLLEKIGVILLFSHTHTHFILLNMLILLFSLFCLISLFRKKDFVAQLDGILELVVRKNIRTCINKKLLVKRIHVKNMCPITIDSFSEPVTVVWILHACHRKVETTSEMQIAGWLRLDIRSLLQIWQHLTCT